MPRSSFRGALAAAALALSPRPAAAQSTPDPSLPPVTEAVSVVGSAPDAVGAASIRESAARDPGEALSAAPGIWKLRKGGFANETVLRGYQAKDLNVLVDGQRIYGACPSHMDPPAVHADFSEVDRIEVVKGPFDVRSQGSLGGLVDIVTKRPEPGFHATANMAAGAAGYLAPAATVSFGGERLAGLAGYSARRADAYRDGAGRRFTELANYLASARDASAFSARTAWGRLAFTPAAGHRAEVSYTHQEMDDVLYPALQMDASWDRADRINVVWGMALAGPVLGALRLQAYDSRVDHFMTDERRTSAGAAPRGWSMATAADARTTGARLEATLLSKVTAGVELFRRSWGTTRSVWGMGRYSDSYSIPGAVTDVAGLYADFRHALSGATSVRAGVRLDRADASADSAKADRDLYEAYHATRATRRADTFVSGSVRVQHRPAEGVEVSLGLGTNVRVPEPNELYYAVRRMGTDWVGNPDLAPSRNDGADLTLSFRRPKLFASAALFVNRVDGYVAVYEQARLGAVPPGGNAAARSYANVDALLGGGEASAVATLPWQLFLSGDLSYVRGSQDADPSRGIRSTRLAEMPPLRVRTALRWDDGRFWAELEGIFSAAQTRVDEDLSETPTAGWGVANVRVGAVWGGFTVAAGVGNLFDRLYEEHLSYQRDPFRSGTKVPEPGRNLFVNVGWRY